MSNIVHNLIDLLTSASNLHFKYISCLFDFNFQSVSLQENSAEGCRQGNQEFERHKGRGGGKGLCGQL